MVSFDGSESCHEAEAYYRDYLEEPSSPLVPESVVRHIESCSYCRSRLQRFRETLCAVEVDEDVQAAQAEKDSQLITLLQSHFEHLEEPLVCTQVKPFLFRLASPTVPIRIPTPITVHVDQCARCAEDLESLRRLRLDPEGSKRLSQLCREILPEGSHVCREAKGHLAPFASMAFERIPADLLDHICVCPHCRDRMERFRPNPADDDGHPEEPARRHFCGEISGIELLDCAVPYGRGTGFFGADRQRAVCEHVRSCPRCLEEVQRIRETVFRIVARPDSDVATVYSIEDRAQTDHEDSRAVSEDTGPLADKAGTMTALKSRAYRTGRIPMLRTKTFGRIAFLSAAMIPLAVLFFLSMPSASGLSVRQVDYILGRAKAVHISTFNDGEEKPFQEQWISRDSQIILFETETERKIYDLRNRQTTILQPGLGVVDRFAMSDEQYEAGRRAMRRSLTSSLDGAPVDAELTHRPAGSQAAHDGLDVYELTWDRSSGTAIPMPRRLKIYIDPITRLPERQEFSMWVPGINDWRAQTTLYEYPDEEVVAARRQALLSAN